MSRILRLEDLEAAFSWHLYPQGPRPGQRRAFEFAAQQDGSFTLEGPVGEGKSEVAHAWLKAHEAKGMAPLYYVTQTKAQVDGLAARYPDMRVAYGRHEHDCFYPAYQDERPLPKADEIPCQLLADCPYRVNQATGETFDPAADTRCLYYDQNWQAKQGGIVLCTMAFFLYTQLFTRQWEKPAALVLDEVHRLPQVVRNCLSYTISDYHLAKAIELLQEVDAPAARQLKKFRRTMVEIIRGRPAGVPQLLETHELQRLIDQLELINERQTIEKLVLAIERGRIDVVEEREVLRKLEVLVRDLRRYRHMLEFSLEVTEPEAAKRNPLNFTYAYYERTLEEGNRVQHSLVIRAYYVAPIIRTLLSPRTLAMSATIGNPTIFGYESGITPRRSPFLALPSTFPAANTRVYLPTDTPDLSFEGQKGKRQSKSRWLKKIAEACRDYAARGHRCLVIVVSEAERQEFLARCVDERIEAVSYGNGTSPKEAVALFKTGQGSVLVGTAAQYGEGIDLPDQLAPIIFFLRPGWPHPNDPQTKFEDKRFGQSVWAVRMWRVIIELLQARGRNMRSAEARGVCFFISQQFRRINVYGVLPEWLRPSYVGSQTFGECVKDSLALLERGEAVTK